MKEWEDIGRIRAVDRVAVQTLRQIWHGLQRVGMLRVICRRGKGRRVLQKTIVRLLQMRFEQA